MKKYLVICLVGFALLGCGGEAMVKSKYEARVHANEKKRFGLMTKERHLAELNKINLSGLPEKPAKPIDVKAVSQKYAASAKGNDVAAATRAYNSGQVTKSRYDKFIGEKRRERYALMAAAIGSGLVASAGVPSSGGYAAGFQSGMSGVYSGSTLPRSGYKYDPLSGNSYNYNTDSMGNTYVRGNNIANGTVWSSTIDKSGNQRGMDSRANSWTYDAASGNYHNFGTGESCYGKGSLRQCY